MSAFDELMAFQRDTEALAQVSGRLSWDTETMMPHGAVEQRSDEQAALEAIRRLLDDDHRIFSLSYHSPSVAPGHTPYVRDEADLANFYRWWDAVFDLFARRGVTACRARELADAVKTPG